VPAGCCPAGDFSGAVVVAPKGRLLYTLDLNSNTISAYTRNTSTGALTSLPTTTARAGAANIAFTTGLAPVRFTPKFAYITNQGSNTISAYSIDATTGLLASVGAVATGNDPSSVAVDPSRQYAFVTNQVDNTISSYDIDATTGALTANAGSPGTGVTPYAIAAHIGGRLIYSSNYSSYDLRAFKINTGGTLTYLSSESLGVSGPYGMTIDPSGRFVLTANYWDDQVESFTIDDFTWGDLTSTGPVAAGSNPYSVAVDPTGRFAYVANAGSDNVSMFSIDPVSGVLTSTGGAVASGAFPRSIAVDPLGRYVYTANEFSNNISRYRIDATTGALISLGTTIASNGPNSITVDASGAFLYVTTRASDQVIVFTINATTGSLTNVGTFATGDSPSWVTTAGVWQ
jgi:6-phosphogluconolactonase (cycloisomerase 2 family)